MMRPLINLTRVHSKVAGASAVRAGCYAVTPPSLRGSAKAHAADVGEDNYLINLLPQLGTLSSTYSRCTEMHIYLNAMPLKTEVDAQTHYG